MYKRGNFYYVSAILTFFKLILTLIVRLNVSGSVTFKDELLILK